MPGRTRRRPDHLARTCQARIPPAPSPSVPAALGGSGRWALTRRRRSRSTWRPRAPRTPRPAPAAARRRRRAGRPRRVARRVRARRCRLPREIVAAVPVAGPRRGAGVARADGRGTVLQLRSRALRELGHVELGSGARLGGCRTGTVLVFRGRSLVAAHRAWPRSALSDLAIDGDADKPKARSASADQGPRPADAGGHPDRRRHDHRSRGMGGHSAVSVQDSVIAGVGAAKERHVRARLRRVAGHEHHADVDQRLPPPRHRLRAARLRPAARGAAPIGIDNRISDINDPKADSGTHEGAIWSGGVAAAIIGNRIRDTGWDRVSEIRMTSTRTTVVGDWGIARTNVGDLSRARDQRLAYRPQRDRRRRDPGINVEWHYNPAPARATTPSRATSSKRADRGQGCHRHHRRPQPHRGQRSRRGPRARRGPARRLGQRRDRHSRLR